MNARRSRQYRRVAQACENCRRKKIRCPGERPRCSACTRLRQQCSFADNDYISEEAVTRIESRMSDRLVQLEDKLDNLMNRMAPQSMQEATPSSASGRNIGTLSYSPSAVHPPALSSTPLPAEIIAGAIEFYFRHIHRQPLWLFEEDSLPTPDTCEELICVIMALSISYNAEALNDVNLRSPDFYSKTARRAIMLRIADGSMTLQGSQALCLLAYLSLISGDIAQAGFDVALAQNITQHSAVGTQIFNGAATSQEQSKLFWSIWFLSTFCGTPTLAPSIPDSITTPRFLTMEARHSFTGCTPLPRETGINQRESLPDIWSQSLRICNLWGDIRLYVAKCIEGVAKCPWQPDSDYTLLCSRLLEAEITYPSSLSYNSVNFPSVLPQDVQSNRIGWLPWLRVQVTYHAIHCVLNHPFLYTVMAEQPKQRLGASTFWRSSYEKALRHCTWISRLIRTAGDKGLQLSDPFFAQAAAIASTLHLYWTRTSDSQLRASSLENLELCRNLVREMARCWPVCRTIEQALDQFIDVAGSSAHSNESQAASTAAKIFLVWSLLDVAAPQFPSYSGHCISNRREWTSGTCIGNMNEEDAELPRSEMHSPPTDMRESTAHYASPPAWVTSRTAGTGSQTGAMQQQEEQEASSVHEVISSDREVHVPHDLAWGPWDHIIPLGENSVMEMNWWDLNNF